MSLRRNAECSTPFAFRPTGAWNWRSKTSCFAGREGPPASPWCATRVFAIRRRAGPKPRRVVAQVEHHQGELFPRVGFIVTSMSLPSRSVVRFYNKRGTAEQWIKEGKQATHWTRLSCHRFRANEVRLQLSVPGLQPGQLVAAARTAAQDQELVADELATQVDEDRRSAGQARAVLLAAPGRGVSEPQAVRRHAAPDLGAACAGWLGPSRSGRKSGR